MRDSCYIISDEYGVQRMTKRTPSLRRGEVGVKVVITIPDSAFANNFPTAQVTVPEDRVIQPPVEIEAVDP